MNYLLLEISDATGSEVLALYVVFIMAIVGCITTFVYLIKLIEYIGRKLSNKDLHASQEK